MDIHLNGGPMHDARITIPDGKDHFHIGGLKPGVDWDLAARGQMPPESLMREGMYSQVDGRVGEFEWDGWRSHD